MAIQKQIVDIPLYGGIDSKTDDFSVGTGKVLALTNADLNKSGSVRKRTGYDILSNKKSEADGNTIQSISTIGTYGDQLLAIGIDGYTTASLSDGPKILTYSTVNAKWTEAGSLTPMEISTHRISSSDSTVSVPSVAQGNGYTVFPYNIFASRSVANVHVKDSFNTIQHQMNASGASYRELKMHYMVGADTTTKKFVGWATNAAAASYGRWSWNTNPGQLDEDANWQNALYEDGSASDDELWDTCRMAFSDGYHHQVLVYKNSSENIQVRVFDIDNNEVASKEIVATPAFSLRCRHIRGDDGVGRIWVMWQDVSDFDIYMETLTDNAVTITSATNIDNSIGTLRAGNMTIARDPQWDAAEGNVAESYTLCYEQLAIQGDGYLSTCKFTVVGDDLASVSNTIGGSAVYQEFFTSANLQAHAFTYGNKAYFPVGYDSTLQATYFIVSLQPNDAETNPFAHVNIHAKIFHNIAGPQRTENMASASDEDFYAKGISETIETSTGNYMFAGLRQDRLLSSGDVQYSVQAIEINMQPAPSPILEVSHGAQIGGAQIGIFDGRYQQLGMPIGPEHVQVTNISYASGGLVDTGSHSYIFVYEWFDSNGQIYRSPPSPAVTVDVLGADNATVQFSVQGLNWGTWETQSLNKIYTYRTAVNGTIYYKSATGSSSGGFANAPISVSDNSSDASLLSQETLYTTGGVLPNVAPPASNIMTAKNDRIFLVPMDDRKAIWYSKPKVDTVAWEFAAEFVTRIDVGGDNTGIAVMDNKIIIFKDESIHAIFGAGPNALGQGQFSPPEPIATDVGAVNHNSIVLMPNGLMFKSHKGIYLLDRSLQVSYVGSPVETYNAANVVKATMVKDKNNIIFQLDGGNPALVYDYFHNQWSTYFNHAGLDATMFKGKYTFVTTSSRVNHNNNESFTDGNFLIDLGVKTGWIHPSGLQAWMRVYTFSLLGHFKSSHTLRVNVRYDYNDTTIAQSFGFVTNTGQLGDEPLQFTGQLALQKCQAIQFEIIDDSRLSSYESMELTGLSLVIGMKTGLNKQPARKRL